MTTSNVYASLAATLGDKEVNITSDTLKVMLCTSSYTPNQGTDKYKSAVTNEITGTGYTAGGATLSSVTWTGSGNVWSLAAANPSWTGASFTFRYAVIYDSTPSTDGTRPLITVVNFITDQTVTSSTATIQWTGGIVCTFTAS